MPLGKVLLLQGNLQSVNEKKYSLKTEDLKIKQNFPGVSFLLTFHPHFLGKCSEALQHQLKVWCSISEAFIFNLFYE